MNNKERIIKVNKFKGIQNSDFPRSALFLDRDGVIISDVGYINKAKDVILEKGIKNLLKYVSELNIPVFVVTNQSGISRGYYDWEDFEKVNERMLFLIGQKSPIVAIFANSHLNNLKNNWRKPNPGMINAATKKYNLKTDSSILVGDRLSDMISGCRSGIKTLVHVKTGHGVIEYKNILKFCKEDFFRFEKFKSKIIFIENLLEFPYELFS